MRNTPYHSRVCQMVDWVSYYMRVFELTRYNVKGVATHNPAHMRDPNRVNLGDKAIVKVS